MGHEVHNREERDYVKLSSDVSFAVLGAGHGGQGLAGYLALKGYKTNLYNRTPEKLEPVHRFGGVNLEGLINGFGKLHTVTSDIRKALRGVDVVMVVIPASGHREMAETLTPHIKNQIIVLNPGRVGGALEFYHVLKKHGKKNVVAEAQTYIFVSRIIGDAQVVISGIKKHVPVAAIPARKTKSVVKILKRMHRCFVEAPDVLTTSMNNIGAIFHPTPLILNAGRVESEGSFKHYFEGITRTVADFLERIDSERIAVAHALGVKAISASAWLKDTYGSEGRDLYERLQNTEQYKTVDAPTTLNHRYIFEDIPTGLVPISSFGRMLGVPTPATDTIITLASHIFNIDFMESGRTTASLGLEGRSVEEIHKIALRGD